MVCLRFPVSTVSLVTPPFSGSRTSTCQSLLCSCMIQTIKMEGWCLHGVQTPNLVCFVLDQWQILVFGPGSKTGPCPRERDVLLKKNVTLKGIFYSKDTLMGLVLTAAGDKTPPWLQEGLGAAWELSEQQRCPGSWRGSVMGSRAWGQPDLTKKNPISVKILKTQISQTLQERKCPQDKLPTRTWLDKGIYMR